MFIQQLGCFVRWGTDDALRDAHAPRGEIVSLWIRSERFHARRKKRCHAEDAEEKREDAETTRLSSSWFELDFLRPTTLRARVVMKAQFNLPGVFLGEVRA